MSHYQLRPFHHVIYMTRLIKDQLAWRGFNIGDVLDFTKLSKSLGDKDILTLLGLNDGSDDRDYSINPIPLGCDTLMRTWRSSVGDDTSLNDRLNTLGNLIQLKEHRKVLESALKVVDDDLCDGDGFELNHDENAIYITLNKEEINLLDKNQTKPLTAKIAREVCKTLSIYNRYNDVALSHWFRLYVEQL